MSQTAEHNDEYVQLASFFVGGEEFVVDILELREIVRPLPVTKVPSADHFIEGAINLRGEVIPIVNMRKRFGMPPRPADKENRIVNMMVDGTVLGLVVDSIGKVRRIRMSQVEPAPAVVASVDSKYIKGIVNLDGTILIALNVAELFSEENLEALRAVGETA